MFYGAQTNISRNHLQKPELPVSYQQLSCVIHSFHSGRWLTICGHSVNSRFCNYKVLQNHIYYNENLFRTTELTKDSSIIFAFRAILTNLQLLAKNHIWLPQKQAKKLHKNPKSKNPSLGSKIFSKMIYA